MKKFKFSKVSIIVFVLVFMFGFVGSNVAFANAIAPTLGSLINYGVVSSTFTNSNTGTQTKIYGDVCATTQPDTVPLLITGTTTTPCAPARNTEQTNVLSNVTYGLNTQSCISLPGGAIALDSFDVNSAVGAPAGTYAPGTYPAGCYAINGAMNITTGQTVTLNGEGNSNAVFIFKSAGPSQALNSADNSSISLIGSASSANVFWAPTGHATIGAFTTTGIPPTSPTFIGTIVDDAGITFGHFANLLGRAIAFGGTVITDANTITTITPYTLHIMKHVVNTGGGTAVASNFNVHVKRGGAEISGSPQVGSEAGTSYLVSAGDFVISEDVNSNYTESFVGCPGGNITVSTDGQDCQITNTYNIPSLTLNKIVVGGSSAESAWTLRADGPTTITGPGAVGATDVVSDAWIGTYDLSETGTPAHYTASAWSCRTNGGAPVIGSSVTIAVNEDVVCTITNTYHAPSSGGGSSVTPVVPVFSPTITILSTPVPVVVAPIIPKLPKTGFAPQEVTWYQSLLNNILNLFR